jgi:L-fuconate dehydratase
MVDANQKWEVQESIDWMTKLAPYKPLWIEEPTNPDDIMGHAAIAKQVS